MVYLDYNSTTPTDPSVLESMIPVFREKFGNPSNENHATGRVGRELVENARKSVADIVNMKPSDVIFTSGATEANNMAILGYAINANRPLRILIGSTEHKSVLEPCNFLARGESQIKKIPVLKNGVIDLVALDGLLDRPSDSRIDIVSVMAANSETGVINPIKEIVQRAHAFGALVHCDATQAIGKISFDAASLDVDIVTFSSHKIYGPKGCGALVANRYARKQIQSMIFGGGQENNMRSGTLNVPGIVGFGLACEIAADKGSKDYSRQETLRDYFETKMMEKIPNITINGKDAARLPNTSSIQIAGALADAVIVHAKEIEISTGSACASAAMEPSHVLIAMGLSTDEANESIRVSIGRETIQQDMDVAVNAIANAVTIIREKEAEIPERAS